MKLILTQTDFKAALNAYNVKPDHLSVFYHGYSFE